MAVARAARGAAGVVGLLVCLVVAGPDDAVVGSLLAGLGAGPGVTLAKAQASSATSYTDMAYNVTYTAPSGWSFSTPTAALSGTPGIEGVVWVPTNPLYSSGYVVIGAYRLTYEVDAVFFGKGQCYNTVLTAYRTNDNSSYAPIVYYARDTAYASGVSYSYITLKQNTYTYVMLAYTQRFGPYVHILVVGMTTANYDALWVNEYVDHWLNLNFISTSAAKVSAGGAGRGGAQIVEKGGIVALTFGEQRDAKLEVFELTSRLRSTLHEGVLPAGTASFALPDGGTPGLLRVVTEKERGACYWGGVGR